MSAAEDAGHLSIIWSEVGSRPVQSHARVGGQGLRLIERIVRARRGTLDIEWKDYGLTVSLRFPLLRLAGAEVRDT